MKTPLLQFYGYVKSIKKYSTNTCIAYRTDIKQFHSFYKANLLLATRRDIIDWIEFLRTEGYQSRSINRKIAALRSFYYYHWKNDNINKKPYWGIDKLKAYKKNVYPIDEDKIIRVLDNFEEGKNKKRIRELLVLELLYYTGCRVNELISIRKRNIDLKMGVIKTKAKGNKERVLLINKRIINLIKLYQSVWRSKNKGRWLFNDDQGRKLYHMYVFRVVKKHLGKDSETSIHPHLIRHSIATHLYNNGASLSRVQKFLGHRQFKSTASYLHPSRERIKEIYDKCFVVKYEFQA
jgi:integrase/recombinase XerC